MSYKPQRTFNGTPGEASTGSGGPLYIENDLNELAIMFNPDTMHGVDENHPEALQGGIHKDHMADDVFVGLLDASDYDPTTDGVETPVKTAGGIPAYVAAKITAAINALATIISSTYQTILTFDNSPTADSSNPVKSSGIKTALDGKANTTHTQAASSISAGTFAGKVQADSTAQATLGNAQCRDITIGTSAMTIGSSSLQTGTIYIQYEA